MTFAMVLLYHLNKNSQIVLIVVLYNFTSAGKIVETVKMVQIICGNIVLKDITKYALRTSPVIP